MSVHVITTPPPPPPLLSALFFSHVNLFLSALPSKSNEQPLLNSTRLKYCVIVVDCIACALVRKDGGKDICPQTRVKTIAALNQFSC